MRTVLAILSGITFLCLGAPPAIGAPQAATAGPRAQAELPPREALQLQDTTAFAAPAPFMFRAGAQCDSDGHAFVQIVLQPAPGRPPELSPTVFELIPDEKRVVSYGTPQLSEQRYPHATMYSYAVLPDGRLYGLIFTRRTSAEGKPLAGPEYYVERFKHDGTMDSITRVETPPGVAHWYADLLAPFPDGGFLIAGTSTTIKERPGAGAWRPFTAVYDSSGRFVREVALPNDITNNWKEVGAGNPGRAGKAKAGASPIGAPKAQQYFDVAIETGGVASGPDGNVWVLRNTDPIRLYAVDSSGQMVQHFEISPPVPGMTPFNFGFAGPDEIFLEFLSLTGRPGTPSSGPSQLVGVFSTTLRQFEALYTASQESKMAIGKTVGNLACSDGRGGFLYLGSTPDDHIAVFDYTAR